MLHYAGVAKLMLKLQLLYRNLFTLWILSAVDSL